MLLFRFFSFRSVANSSKIDQAFESIFNIGFYAILACIILSWLNFDPLALFLSLSGIVLAFAFMIGSASAKYFEVSERSDSLFNGSLVAEPNVRFISPPRVFSSSLLAVRTR